MKKTLLLSLLLSTAPVAAFAADLAIETQAPVVVANGGYSGYVGVTVSASNYDYWGDDYNPWVGYGIDAALAYTLDSNLSIGVDVKAFAAGDSDDNGYYTVSGGHGALHLNMLADGASYGVFGGISANNDYYESGVDFNATGGVEGKVALTDQVLVSGQAGFIHQLSGYYEMGTLGFVGAGIAFFPTDNIKLSADIGGIFGQIGDDSDETAKTLTYGLEAAYKFDDSPISVFARFSGYQDYDYLEGYGGQTLSIGARFSFDGESLKSQSAKINTVQDLSAVSWLRNDGW